MSATDTSTPSGVAATAPLDRDLHDRLLTAIAHELAEVGSAIPDREAATKLSHAHALLQWVQQSAAADAESIACLETEVRALLTSGTAGSSHPQLRRTLRLLSLARTAHGPTLGERAEDNPTESEPTPELITEYLRTRPGGEHDEAHQVRTVHGGFSKRTLLIGATLAGRPTEFVIRQIPLGRSARALAPEFDIVRTTFAAGLPVPEPLWIEPEHNPLGGPFFVTRKAFGENLGDVWGPAGVTRQICEQVATIYARLHALPVADLHPPISPRATPEDLQTMLDWQENTLAKRNIAPAAELEALFCWLREHLPPPTRRQALIHGDAAFSNILVHDNHVSAVLDWEASHLGDPAEELAYLRPSITPVLPWEEFLDAYRAAGGATPHPDSLRFFEVWQHVWRHIGCLWMAQNFDAGNRYAAAVAGYVHGPRFLAAGLEAAFGPFD
ncbi:phosphotransferase family protein [Nocardia sp. R16R-3T]